MWWKILLFVGMTAMIIASYVTPAPQQQIGESSRIFYYHIPQAWICVLAFLMSMLYSVMYLTGIRISLRLSLLPIRISFGQSRDVFYDDRAVETARLGFVFCLLATVTGSIFARIAWGSFWNWDPRETSVFVLLLIYGAYFALRGAVQEPDRRAALSGVYSIFAFVTVPFLIFVLPRIVPSLHPENSVVDSSMEFTMGPLVRVIFFASLALYTVLYFWMLNLSGRIGRLVRVREDLES